MSSSVVRLFLMVRLEGIPLDNSQEQIPVVCAQGTEGN